MYISNLLLYKKQLTDNYYIYVCKDKIIFLKDPLTVTY